MADRVGKSRVAVANTVRLLRLPEPASVITPVATARMGVPEGAEKSSPVWQFAHR